ncbi:MAG TPA: zf-HC2 domain-containing protein [Solirubrobacteraceae bacterium]|jgi:anti-sigma factor RsiW
MPLFAQPLVCQEFVEFVTAYLDGSLSRRDRRRVEKHLGACDGCTAYLESFRVTVDALGELPAEPVEPHVREHLLAAFRELRG